jgi:hypothetical protein
MKFLKDMGITPDEREIMASFDGEKIILEKKCNEMRDLTSEEEEACSKALDKMSESTNIKVL